MALWVWRFVEGEPPHFFRAPQYLSTESILYIYEVLGGGKKGSVEKYWGTETKT